MVSASDPFVASIRHACPGDVAYPSRRIIRVKSISDNTGPDRGGKDFREEWPSRTVMRWRAVQRLAQWHFWSGRLPLYLVTEFPKSGATWYSKMLSECIGVPFPPQADPPRWETSILRSTVLYNPRFRNVTVVMRDGRDVMVSAYYHFLFHNEANAEFGVEQKRAVLQFSDYDDIRTNMPTFIDYMFQTFPREGWSTRFHWARFVDSWMDQEAPIVRYEDLLSDPAAQLRRVSHALTGQAPNEAELQRVVEKYSFKALTGRKSGEEKANAFLRKGIAGDWRNVFSREAAEKFNRHAGAQLIRLGYEADDRWVSSVD